MSVTRHVVPELVEIEPANTPFVPRSADGAVAVLLGPFRLGRFPVTNVEFEAFVRSMGRPATPWGWADGAPRSGEERHPVRGVSAADAEAYCRWLSNLTGLTFRLPQEVEWEYAAGGAERRLFPWGDEFDPRRCNSAEGGRARVAPVGAYPQGASPVGCEDMAGNVAEYCADIHRAYDSPDPSGALDHDGALSRVVRGGSFLSTSLDVRCDARRAASADDRHVLGFRICSA